MRRPMTNNGTESCPFALTRARLGTVLLHFWTHPGSELLWFELSFHSTQAFNDRHYIATGDATLMSVEDTTANCGFSLCLSMSCKGGQQDRLGSGSRILASSLRETARTLVQE